jgi:hypothetical protein
MESSRRGFFATLAGALLGATVGPKLVAAPTPDLWRAVPKLPLPPVLNTYVPLEVVCAETLKIVNEELKWLRLTQLHGGLRNVGDTWMVREPARLDLRPSDLNTISQGITDRLRVIHVCETSNVEIDLRDADVWRPLNEFDARHIKPAAYGLAEAVIKSVRRNGGAEYLASVDQAIPSGVYKGVVMSNPESGLSIRALEAVVPEMRGGKLVDWKPVLHIDMLYGLG